MFSDRIESISWTWPGKARAADCLYVRHSGRLEFLPNRKIVCCSLRWWRWWRIDVIFARLCFLLLFWLKQLSYLRTFMFLCSCLDYSMLTDMWYPCKVFLQTVSHKEQGTVYLILNSSSNYYVKLNFRIIKQPRTCCNFW